MKEFRVDKRTDEQRKNDAAQKVRKGSAQDTHLSLIHILELMTLKMRNLQLTS